MIKIDEFEGVTRFVMGREVAGKVEYWCASYLVDGLLIDTGCAHTADEFLAALRGRRVERVVNTHYHEDHVGANAAIAREFKAPLFAPADSIEAIAAGYPLSPAREMVWGAFEPSRPQPLGESISTGSHTFEAFHTPGHSPDHVALVERERGWAFVGDVFITEEPRTCRLEDDHNQTLASFQKLRRAGVRVLFTGLGRIVEDAPAVLQATIQYLEETRELFLNLSKAGMSPAEIVARQYGRESSLHAMTSGEISYENFVRSFLPKD